MVQGLEVSFNESLEEIVIFFLLPLIGIKYFN